MVQNAYSTEFGVCGLGTKYGSEFSGMKLRLCHIAFLSHLAQAFLAQHGKWVTQNGVLNAWTVWADIS